MDKNWKVKDINAQLQLKLSAALNVDPIVAQLLINRNIDAVDEATDFLSAKLDRLHNPLLLKGMQAAVNRIKLARQHKQKVLIFGDYDVDGVTSSAMLNRALRSLDIDVIHHIPHRVDDGYGLNCEIAQYARQQGVSLLIAVDCGINAFDEVNAINALGIDVIIIDHHEPDEDEDLLPKAFAIIDPKQKDCPYPFKELASVGLVFKLTHALFGTIRNDFLDLAAIGTIADVVPLRGENRIIVKAGLPRIARTTNKGLRALLDVARVDATKIRPFHIGFVLGPRINAAGRMDSAHTSLDLFLTDDDCRARDLARALNQHNNQRQKMQQAVVAEALEIVEQEVNFHQEKVIVLSKEGWHKGVIGIAAARITDKYYRPSIVISIKDGVGVASARSINGFHLHSALTECSDCLENFGGHAAAAGLTIREENIDIFRNLINNVAAQVLDPIVLMPTLSLDCEILLSDIDMDFVDIVNSMEPYGEGNPVPVFCSRGVTVKSRPMLMGKDTLKFWITDGNATISAIGFGMAKFEPLVAMGARVDLAYELIVDDWNKAPVPQLKLKDIKLSQSCQLEYS